MRQGGVAALALDGDFEFVAGGHDRASTDRELAHRHARPVVQTKHRIHREFLEQAVLDHFAGTAAALFRRLKNQHHGAVKVAVLGQVLRSRQQHGGVAVMAASVHLAHVLAGMGEGVGLVHRQRVHVGTQSNTA